MPIYEYRCTGCRKTTTALVLVRSREGDVRYANCVGGDLTKLVSRFATPRSEEARLDQSSDPASFAVVDENDPKSVAQWMKKDGPRDGRRRRSGLRPGDRGGDGRCQRRSNRPWRRRLAARAVRGAGPSPPRLGRFATTIRKHASGPSLSLAPPSRWPTHGRSSPSPPPGAFSASRTSGADPDRPTARCSGRSGIHRPS